MYNTDKNNPNIVEATISVPSSLDHQIHKNHQVMQQSINQTQISLQKWVFTEFFLSSKKKYTCVTKPLRLINITITLRCIIKRWPCIPFAFQRMQMYSLITFRFFSFTLYLNYTYVTNSYVTGHVQNDMKQLIRLLLNL